jgi:hypothetical protein
LKTVNYNTLNYGTSEAVTVSLTIAYDNAIQNATPGQPDGPISGVGAPIGRILQGEIATGIGSGT